MEKAEILQLFTYNSWANHRVLSAVGRLNPDQYTAPNPCTGYGSLRGILAHILTAEIVWRLRIQGKQAANGFLDVEEYPVLDNLVYRWGQEDESLMCMLEELTGEQLNGMIAYTNRRGEHFEQSCWGILMHVINHGTHHRSEIAGMLMGYGVPPGDLDLIYFLRQNGLQNIVS